LSVMQTIHASDSYSFSAASDLTPDLSVVIPIYNEAASLPGLHAELSAALANLGLRYEILAVDDGSQDDSAPCCTVSRPMTHT